MPTHIPLEILGRIFELVLPDVLDDMTHKSLVLLCLICKDWRDAVYLNHQLWRKIYIDHPTNQYLPHEKVLLWHSRSGGLPRSLEYMSTCLTDPDSCDSEGCDSPNTVLARILRHSPRIDHLKIHCQGPQCIRSLQASFDGMGLLSNSTQEDALPSSFEQLPIASWALHWSQTPKRKHPVPLPPISSFQLDIRDNGGFDTYRFENAFVAGILNQGGMAPRVPGPRKTLSPATLQNLTSLSLNSNWDVTDLSEILGACVVLLNLTLELRTTRSYIPTTDSVKRNGIALLKVQSLCLRQLAPKSLSILDVLRLHVGNLRHLDISFRSRNQAWTFQDTFSESELEGAICSSWNPFIGEHIEFLETLSIRDASRPSDATLKSLVSTELYNIQRFTLDGIVPPSSFFSGDCGPSFSHLASLSLLNMNDTFSEEEVLEFLKSRRGPYQMVEGKRVFEGPPDTIKHVTITYQEPPGFQPYLHTALGWGAVTQSEEALSRVDALAKAGIVVDIGPIYRLSNGNTCTSWGDNS